MTFLSYAPNAEDVLLWRALGHIPNGRYIDWGGDDPANTSFTRAFYDRGWSGLAIRPTEAAAAHLAALRPRDSVVAESAFHAGLLTEAHFLRTTGAALAALDLATIRPWVVVLPASDDAPALAGYQPCLFDGVNRFYTAPGRPDLARALAVPANATDGFRRAADDDAAQQAATLAATLEAAELRAAGARAQIVEAVRTAGRARADALLKIEDATWLRARLDDAQVAETSAQAEAKWRRDQSEDRQQQLLARTGEVAWLRGCLAESDRRADALDARLRQAEAAAAAAQAASTAAQARSQAELTALRSSTSWRVTAPLRRLRGPTPAAEPALALSPPPAPLAPHPEPLPAPAAIAPPPTPALPPPVPTSPPLAAQPVLAPEPPATHTTPATPALVTTVHQFHAGSAPHDAITNAMLLIRTRLRAAGFRSDIFVEHRAAGLEHAGIHLLAAMPRHAGYVLLLHHSMGHPSFDAVLALPAPKILVYHNITPPAFLAAQPRIQRLAEDGRRQLAQLRDHVAFALADSAFNAAELHTLGYPAVRTCPLLFDVERLMRPPQGLRPDDGVFTVLFVGRVTPSKGQDALIAAFAAFRTRFPRPCRLVLAGALDQDEHAYLDRLTAQIAAAGLDDHVHLLGLVPDAELAGWFHQADLYVSLSRHEGFGVPLIEAAAQGIPVLAWPTGAVPSTLAHAGTTLASREPDAVADAMLAAIRPRGAPDPALRRFALDRQWPTLLAALATAGAWPPFDAEARQAINATMRFAITGHLRGSYSLAAINRSLAAAIEAARPGAVRLLPLEDALPPALHELAARPAPDTGPELVISNHYPVHRPEGAALAAALFYWEESLIPPATVATLNAGFTLVLAPSRFVAKALVDSGVHIPVINIGGAPALAPFTALTPDPAPRPFTFLHISSAFPRKGVDVLLAAWAEAFTATDPVRLILKTFPNPHSQIQTQRAAYPNAAPITLIDEDLDEPAMLALYAASDAAVLPTRGEGYNLPAAEAMAAGLPLIVTAAGGHMDFCTPTTARLLRYTPAPSASHLAPPHSLWAEPDRADLVAALREAASGQLAPLAAPARAAILAHADPAALVARIADAATCALLLTAPPPLRTAWLTSWDVRCGVAEYTRALLAALPRDGLAIPTILADHRTPPAPTVHPSWHAGNATSAAEAADAVAQADPDVLVIQHQPGLLPWTGLADLLNRTADPHRVRVVTLHNTRHLLDIPEADRAATVAALHTADRVLVHTLADLRRLHQLGLADVATLLPHPAPPPAHAPIRALQPDAAPVIGCTGFFLPDKGIGQLIAAAVRLRPRWPGIRLRLVNAEYDDPASTAEIAACRAAAAAEGLAIEWHTSFLPLPEQHALLQGCDLIVLPYQRSKEGSSAALRSALGTGVPVAVTPLELFAEAEDAVYRLPGIDPAPMALAIGHLLGNPDLRTRLSADARAWLATRALPDVAARLAGILRGLATQRRIGNPPGHATWPVSSHV